MRVVAGAEEFAGDGVDVVMFVGGGVGVVTFVGAAVVVRLRW